MQIITDIEQGTQEWHDLRLGVTTASRFKDILARGGGATRKRYMREIAAEIITGQREEGYSNEYMEWGTATEPQARAMYELSCTDTVREVAFIKMDDYKAGCSPDGLVSDNGGLEIKCPKTATQIETFLSGKMPAVHKAQVQGSMWVSGREWWDFVSFDPRINGRASYFCIRVERDQEYIDNLAKEVKQFEVELSEMVKQLS
jgi:putative phage-type endonuclease